MTAYADVCRNCGRGYENHDAGYREFCSVACLIDARTLLKETNTPSAAALENHCPHGRSTALCIQCHPELW